jgi:hypothetical protein
MAEADVVVLVVPEVILFEDRDFLKAHKHIFKREDNVGAPPSGFATGVSSLVVRGKSWLFFTEKDCTGTPTIVQPGAYKTVQEVGIPNDRILSLKPAD